MWTPACCEICKIIPLASTKGVKFGHLRALSCGLGNLHLQARKCLKNVSLTTNRNLGFLHIFVITGGRETKYGSFWSNPWIPARDVSCEGGEPKIWIRSDELLWNFSTTTAHCIVLLLNIYSAMKEKYLDQILVQKIGRRRLVRWRWVWGQPGGCWY